MDSTIVWADCEMTGLDIDHDVLLEVAIHITDAQLNIIDDGFTVVIHAGEEKLSSMVDVVQKMHAASGLIHEVRASSVTVEQAQDQILTYLQQFVEPQQAPLAGNSIATDRAFIRAQMPLLDEFLHYRMIDVSSVKELTRRWFPRAYYSKPDKGLAHRALSDIKESIMELQYYRQAVFVPEPGYSTEHLNNVRDEIMKAQGSSVHPTV